MTNGKPPFKVFLSHRYKSPKVNRRFFELLARYGDIQFAVDTGTKATNVTRLERFVREADAFVGIYPFPSDDDVRPTLDTALKASRYFRLELDLAIRARRPAIVFIDGRYGNAIAVPATVRQYRYSHQEVEGAASLRDEDRLATLAGAFCDEVATAKRLTVDRAQPTSDRVGILLLGAQTYDEQQLTAIERRLTTLALSPVRMDWKSAIDGRFLNALADLDWIIVDVGAEACATGLPAFLHGHFVPQMRLMRVPETDRDAQSPLEQVILAAFEVGYPKDIVRWYDGESLDEQLVQRLTTLYEPRKYIASSDEALRYFNSASLRNETVFLSYSGEDRDAAAKMAVALKARFQNVFDYRDQGESIIPGRRWIDEVFDKLAASAIGIPLLSASYFASGNCAHEAREMVSLSDQGKLSLVPVKLNEGALELPTWMRDLQYLRGWGYERAEALVIRIEAAYDAGKAGA